MLRLCAGETKFRCRDFAFNRLNFMPVNFEAITLNPRGAKLTYAA
jgi:hypothetical protein